MVNDSYYSLVNPFGKVTGATYSSLEDNTVLISDTTLYCVTENKNTPEVMWSYVDLAGTSTDLTSTTDASTGVSTIQVYTTQPGYYSCEVTENGGSSRTYTAVMTDTDPDTGLFFLTEPYVHFYCDDIWVMRKWFDFSKIRNILSCRFRK